MPASRLSEVGTTRANSFSTVVTTPVSMCSVASRNMSRVSRTGSDPVNSGAALLRLFRWLSRFHFAVLVIRNSFGLNWNAIVWRTLPGVDVPLRGGLRTSSLACSSRAALAPPGPLAAVAVKATGEPGIWSSS